MIVSAEYLRLHYTDHEAGDDTAVGEFITDAQGTVSDLIGQPVEARAVVHYFTGDGRTWALCPYTIAPALGSIEYQQQPAGSWTALSSSALVSRRLESLQGFANGVRYRANLTVGLATSGASGYSATITSAPQYRELLRVVCEVATVRFLESAHSNEGVRRFALSKLSESVGGALTRSYDFDDLVPRWRSRLARFLVLGAIW